MNTQELPDGILGSASMCALTKQALTKTCIEMDRLGTLSRRCRTYWEFYTDGTGPTSDSIHV
eukprot:524741-Pyramimonas_sp.AAC.1